MDTHQNTSDLAHQLEQASHLKGPPSQQGCWQALGLKVQALLPKLLLQQWQLQRQQTMQLYLLAQQSLAWLVCVASHIHLAVSYKPSCLTRPQGASPSLGA